MRNHPSPETTRPFTIALFLIGAVIMYGCDLTTPSRDLETPNAPSAGEVDLIAPSSATSPLVVEPLNPGSPDAIALGVGPESDGGSLGARQSNKWSGGGKVGVFHIGILSDDGKYKTRLLRVKFNRKILKWAGGKTTSYSFTAHGPGADEKTKPTYILSGQIPDSDALRTYLNWWLEWATESVLPETQNSLSAVARASSWLDDGCEELYKPGGTVCYEYTGWGWVSVPCGGGEIGIICDRYPPGDGLPPAPNYPDPPPYTPSPWPGEPPGGSGGEGGDALTQRINAIDASGQDAYYPDDVPCGLLHRYAHLANEPFEPTAQNRIDQVSRDASQVPTPHQFEYRNFQVRRVGDGAGNIVNMDSYAVNISSLPTGFTPETYLEYIRTNINSYVDNSLSQFTFPNGELSRWMSNDPIGTYSTINFYLPFSSIPANQGTVVVTRTDPHRWVFSTVRTTFDGNHPVSGDREFGITQNSDGTYTLYTRGVDRITSTLSLIGRDFIFDSGARLWRSLVQKVVADVNGRGGAATPGETVSYRPDWNLIELYFDGLIPLDVLKARGGCSDG